MTLKHSLIALLLGASLSLTSPVMASEVEFQQAVSHITNQNYDQAFNIFKKLAEQGDAAAQNELGYMYADGKGVRQDYHQAVAWYRKAAEQGNAMAQYNLGVMYDNGKGVRQNYSVAKEWYGKACDLGHQQGCDEYRKLSQRGY